MNLFKRCSVAAAISFACVAASSSAHHSFAAYNVSKTLTAIGTIKEFRWGAPHSSIVVTYTEKGQQKVMSLVSGSPLMFSKQGFNPRDFRRGDKITVSYHPNISGQPGGALSSLKLPNGKTFSDTELARTGAN